MKRYHVSASMIKKSPTRRTKALVLTAAVLCALTAGTFLTACSPEPEETQVANVWDLESYAKVFAAKGANQVNPAAVEAFARWIDKEDGFLETYPEKWIMEQQDNIISLSCYSPLTEDFKRTVCTLHYDGVSVSVYGVADRQYTDVPRREVIVKIHAVPNAWEIQSFTMKIFIDYLMEAEWFPNSTQWAQCESEWYIEKAPLPDSADQTEYTTLFMKFWKKDSNPGDPATLRSVYILGNEVLERDVVEIVLSTEVTVPTEPTMETTPPATEPPQTEPDPTEPTVPFVKEDSPAYQKLLTLPNAEEFLCNRHGKNELAILAEWIDSLEGVMETYPERWYLRHYGDDGTGFFCYSPLEADNSCDYMDFTLWYGGMIITEPSTGRRYFTDIPREEIAGLVYGAYDPLGVDREIKERMIDHALFSEYFAWNVMEPGFRILDSYYEIITIWPYPEYEPDNYFERITLAFHVWRPGMAEDEYIKCWLGYDEEMNMIYYSSDSIPEGFLSGIIYGN